MKRSALVSGLALILSAGPAFATICTIDAVPAGTLLLPYFEVDLNNPNGLTTLFSVNNANKHTALAHAIIWSDLAVPVLDFNIYLTGYDVQSVNLRDIIVNGNLPQTAPLSEDPNDTISPRGPLSKDGDYPGCQGVLPPPALPSFLTAYLQAALTGQPVAIVHGNCAGQALGDNIARGYITVDMVTDCSTKFPGDAGYFSADGTGDVDNVRNHLWGDWMIVNSAQNFAEGGTLVAIESDTINPATSTPGNYTFYGRYDNWTAIDYREPLATTFGTRFLNGGPFSGGTSLLVWRDPKVPQTFFTCPATPGTQPPWYALGQELVAIFNEQENVLEPVTSPNSPLPAIGSFAPFPAATQRVQVGGASLPVPYSFGWLWLDLNTTVAPAGSNPPIDPAASQAFVFSTLESNGHFAVGIEAIRLDSACAANHAVP
ncbi:MAG TPA: hypothetical protein VMW75_14360 [Thermoanaerobaculia bacterium]|nr:hypothetical protein [Thermoanaerobaculia bacterium]